jgi:hypothetical protein
MTHCCVVEDKSSRSHVAIGPLVVRALVIESRQTKCAFAKSNE